MNSSATPTPNNAALSAAARAARELDARIGDALMRYWGYDSLRPLQREAIEATLARRDSLVVLPTGGGKSLCYQLPAVLRPPGQPALTLVVSPLIALMKDQIDGLRLAGFPAGALHSGISGREAAEVMRGVEQGRVRLLMVSPERLLMDGTLAWLSERRGTQAVSCVVVDEAHCISQWGHDFRPEYRRLATLREVFPGVPMHAYTATATVRVREDIALQLEMKDPAVLVGTFDRPNLAYRVLPRLRQGEDQVAEVLERHRGEAAIVYCISRKQTESLADDLSRRGFHAAAYHAGLEPAKRSQVQDAFIAEDLDVVVATVAFGMGIDRGNVRAVIHASMPKSVEAYQQETGRAGRDGLPSECVLFYAASDMVRWGQLIDKSAAESEVEVPPQVLRAQRDLLYQMQRLVSSSRCRHKSLSEYFGQEYLAPGPDGCGACDVCLNELDIVPDSTERARKILSCVARLRGNHDAAFGAAYIADVLRGSNRQKIIDRGHHQLSTFGLMREVPKDVLINHIDQLVDMGALVRDSGPYPVISLTRVAGPILRNELPVAFYRARSAEAMATSERKRRRVDSSGKQTVALSGEEMGLFSDLRALRRDIAKELGVPPFVVLSDATLEEMCRVRPGSPSAFLSIKGIGRQKLDQFGARFVQAIVAHCEARGMALNVGAVLRPAPVPRARVAKEEPVKTDTWKQAFGLFARGVSIDEVVAKTGRTRATVGQYLVEFIELVKPDNVRPWVTEDEERQINRAIGEFGEEKARPIHESLGGVVSYEAIRAVMALRRARR